MVQSLDVNKAAQTITFPSLADKSTQSSDFGLTATASSALPVNYSSSDPTVATISGNTVTVMGAGTTTIVATQAGNDVYLPADNASQTLTVVLSEKLDQVITFGALPTKTQNDAPFALNAAASSGLPVSFANSNPSVATIDGSTVTIVGPGTSLITASQAGNDEFLAANSAVQTLTVNGAPVFTRQPADAARAVGESITFSTTVGGFPTPTLQWRFNGSPIAGATGNSLTLSDLGTVRSGSYDVVATNSVGTATSTAASLVVIPENYEGTYFGTLSDGSEWAMQIRADQTGVFIAYLVGRTSALVIDVVIEEDGSFSVVGSEFVPNPPTSQFGLVPPMARAESFITLSGTLNDGQLEGTIPELALSATGAAIIGSATPTSGLYRTRAADPADGSSITIIAPNGKLLAVTVSDTQVDGASGIADPTGNAILETFTGGQMVVSITATSRTARLAYANATGDPAIEFLGTADDVEPNTRLSNLSVRSRVGSGEGTLIAGFVINGSGNKSLLIRAVGPTLQDFGVTDALPDPTLNLFNNENLLTGNNDWGDSGTATNISALAQELGAFPLDPGSRDAALNTALSAKAYTNHVSSADGSSGVALLEVYDAESDAAAFLTNLSVRTSVTDQAGGLIMGFVVDGNTPLNLLIRAVGPSLANFGVTGFLADPVLRVVDGNQEEIGINDNWGGSSTLSSTFTSVGAFEFDSPDSKDAAILLNLEPGVYTVLISGATNNAGVALAEIYVVP